MSDTGATDLGMPDLDGVFHALSDGTRRAVIARLACGPASIGELARPHRMALPSFLKHVRVLEAHAIVLTRKRGRVRVCELRPEALAQARTWLERERAAWERRLDRLDAFVETLPVETLAPQETGDGDG